MQTNRSIETTELVTAEDAGERVDYTASLDEDYFQGMTEDLYFSLDPASTLTYAAGYSLGSCLFLWLADMLAVPQALSLLRLTRGSLWSYGLVSTLVLGVVTCLYLRAKARRTHDIADGAFDGALVIGMTCTPAAMRVSPVVPISVMALSLLAVYETVPRIRREQACPWPEPWLPVALAAETLLKRASVLSAVVIGAHAAGLL